jgi:hypothetical protein
VTSFKLSLPKVWPFKIEHTTKRQLTIIQKNEFKICQPATREKPEWLGFKKRFVAIHLTADGEWNIRPF